MSNATKITCGATKQRSARRASVHYRRSGGDTLIAHRLPPHDVTNAQHAVRLRFFARVSHELQAGEGLVSEAGVRGVT
jgi:hypothetical protein